MSSLPDRRTRKPDSGNRRGLSLIEALVVLMIGVIVLLAAFPIAVDLMREGKGLSAELLTGETLPHLHERLSQDLLAAASASLGRPEGKPDGTFQMVLTPPAEVDPLVIYDLATTEVVRTVKSRVPGDTTPSGTRKWQVPGRLDLLPEELLLGRLGFVFKPEKGEDEILVFALPGTVPGVRESS